MKKFFKLCLLTLTFILAGCATTMKLTPQNRELVHTIKVDPNVNIPNGMYFYGDGAQYAQSFGIIGMMVSADITDKDTRQINLEEERNKINFREILLGQVNQEIMNSKKFKVVKINPDATLFLKVIQYGFMATNMGFSNSLAPIVGIEGQLVRNGKIIWINSASVMSPNYALPSFTMKEIAKDPSRIKLMWETATHIASQKLISDLKQ